jgi:hypothetical protein
MFDKFTETFVTSHNFWENSDQTRPFKMTAGRYLWEKG